MPSIVSLAVVLDVGLDASAASHRREMRIST